MECNNCWRRFEIEGDPDTYCQECGEGMMHYLDPKDTVAWLRKIEKQLQAEAANG